MNCDDLQPLLGAHMDGELDLVTSMKAEEHLAQCADCLALLEKQAALGAAIAEHVPRYSAPAGLRAKVLAAVVNAAGSENAAARPALREGRAAGAGVVADRHGNAIDRKPATREVMSRHVSSQSWAESLWECGGLLNRCWPQAAMLAAVAVTAFCAGYVARFPSVAGGVPVLATADPLVAVANEAVSNHIRSLLASHLADVPSTDQHTVKPWFAGRLDYSPTVVDLAASGFPLTGGRLDVLQNRPVAALVYQRRKHIINLFVQTAAETSSPQNRANGATPENPAVTQRNGYNALVWHQNNTICTAVSDVSEADLREFAKLFAEQTALPAKR